MKNVYFIAGTPCGGKTTVSRALGRKFGIPVYDIDERFEEHQRISDKEHQPAMNMSFKDAGCCVATGDFTIAIFVGTEHKNCDIAAIKIIVEEAGGVVTDLFGNEQRYDCSINGALISNGKVHDEVVDIIKKNIIKNSNLT